MSPNNDERNAGGALNMEHEIYHEKVYNTKSEPMVFRTSFMLIPNITKRQKV
ncbi:hypothetical protein QCA50_003948 [Cerrena zonata]|uniref:Uncharacterized protein n=1 Tax=Cerrena zonata TaxID=2478898 RepID=A0AAW0GFJ6_9APHY